MTLAWAFEDEADAYADSVLDALAENGAVVPGLWSLEVANVLVVSERRGRLAQADSTRFLELLQELPLETEETTLESVPGLISLVREQSLSSYDAAYLHLAMRRGLSLATRDERLRRAAAAGGVALFGS